MLFLRIKSKYSLLFIVLNSFCISLLLALIHAAFTINIFFTIGGLTLFLSGAFLSLRNKNLIKTQPRLVEINQVEVIPNNERNISTNSGHYNEIIGRDFIGRDSVTKNVKNITIGNREVEINPNDIAETFYEFRDILTQSITQSSNASEAISEFAKELTEELRKQPELKFCFDIDKNIGEQELVNKIFVDLLNKSYEQINEIHPITRITSDQIKKINNSSDSAYIEHFEYNGNGEYDILYRGYTVHLFQDQSKWWHSRIRRSNLSLFEDSNTKRSRNIYFAIGRAIDQIEKEIERNWKNSMTNPE
jgi:hypothetical protein